LIVDFDDAESQSDLLLTTTNVDFHDCFRDIYFDFKHHPAPNATKAQMAKKKRAMSDTQGEISLDFGFNYVDGEIDDRSIKLFEKVYQVSIPFLVIYKVPEGARRAESEYLFEDSLNIDN